MTRSEISEFTSWLGKRSYEARLARFGIERLQEIARENGKKGGRPVGSGKKQRPSASSGLRAAKAVKKTSGTRKGR